MLDRRKHIEDLLESAQLLRRRASRISRFEDDGITASQWLVVGHIFRSEGCTTNEVAKALNMTGSAATQLLNGLVAKGYVRRQEDPTDRRAHKLLLSPRSKKRISEFKKKRVEMMLKMFEALSDTEFEHYLALNKKIVQKLSSTKDL